MIILQKRRGREQRPGPGPHKITLDRMIRVWYHYGIMKLLNREVDYAVRAMVLMTRANKPTVSVAQMQEGVGVNRPFLRKILQKLHKAGLLQASKGKGGGFSAAKAPENIRLSDLIAALQGPVKLNDCFFRKKLCRNHGTCLLRRRIGEVEARLAEEMERITLKDLV